MEDVKKIGTSAHSKPEDDDELETEEKQKKSTSNNGSKQEKKTPPKFDVHWRPSSFTEVKKPNGEGKQTFTDMKKKVTTTEKTTFLGIKEGEKSSGWKKHEQIRKAAKPQQKRAPERS
eukprot:m.240003 g.240003  ORF g.240003 m.240003 type:complete len:118 (+) comp40188_c0_seq16:592-945(+)